MDGWRCRCNHVRVRVALETGSSGRGARMKRRQTEWGGDRERVSFSFRVGNLATDVPAAVLTNLRRPFRAPPTIPDHPHSSEYTASPRPLTAPQLQFSVSVAEQDEISTQPCDYSLVNQQLVPRNKLFHVEEGQPWRDLICVFTSLVTSPRVPR